MKNIWFGRAERAKRLSYEVVAAAWLAVFCLYGYRATFSVLLGPMREAMHWTAAQTSLAYSLMMFVYALTASFSGMIVDRWGPRPAFATAAVAGALGFYLTSLARSYRVFLASYAICGGIGTGMLWVTSTVSVRKWCIGSAYATMWGLAYTGAPVAQVVLSLGVKRLLTTSDWRAAMRCLSWIVFGAMAIAAVTAKRNPEAYNVTPFGYASGRVSAEDEYSWGVREALKTFPMWGVIVCWLTSAIAEFLLWAQLVPFWTNDCNLALSVATNLYVTIGLAGLLTMPVMGWAADRVVVGVQGEVLGRKIMLIVAPAVGAVACLLLLASRASLVPGVVACVLFALYWAIEPGGVAGYAGSLYGRAALGRIWGVATLIVMGIGPAAGSYVGGYLYDISGSYRMPILFALGAYTASTLVAVLLPVGVRPLSRARGSPLSLSLRSWQWVKRSSK